MTSGRDQIDAALFAAQQAIGSVGKSSRNDFHKYAYVSAESMIAACRPVLHENGLLVQRDAFMVDMAEGRLENSFTVKHLPSGESRGYSFPWPFIAEKGRPIDKALAGALTVSMNYFLRDLLLVPRMDESEMDRRDDRDYEPPPAKPRKKAEPKPEQAEDQEAIRSAEDVEFVNRRDVAALSDRMGGVWLSRVLKKCSAELGRPCASIDEISHEQVVRILKHHTKE
jgi:hypothetical protein